jgi:hypothetical protein
MRVYPHLDGGLSPAALAAARGWGSVMPGSVFKADTGKSISET